MFRNKRGFGDFLEATFCKFRSEFPPALPQSPSAPAKISSQNLDSNLKRFHDDKKGASVLVENVVFIILNVVFLSILVTFVLMQSGSGKVLEEKYAKEISLITDYAKPEMIIKIDMRKGLKVSDKNEIDFGDVVKVTDNVVFVKLTPEGGHTYSFFNNVNLNEPYPETNEDNTAYTGFYILTITEKLGGQNE